MVQTYEDYRRAMRSVVRLLSDDELQAEIAKERPYSGRDERRGLVMFRAMAKVELRRRQEGQ